MKEFILKIKDIITLITIKIGDKKMHTICAFIITFIIGLFNLISGLISGIIISIVKEVFDEFRKRKYQDGVGFSTSDLLADAIGIISAIIILLVL